MEKVRRKFLKGSISKKQYRMQVITSTISFLIENHQYEFVKEIGMGTYGAVVELKRPNTDGNVAAKIVLQELATVGEKELWADLSHENLLPLISMDNIRSTYSYAFISPRLPECLDFVVEGSFLRRNSDGFERAKSWLRGINSGLKYLHDRKLCHLDIKMSNVLISDNDTAVIGDFGSLTRTEAVTNNYISPFIYRPPEGLKSITGQKAQVNGYHYDIYTVGMLCLELFTKRALLQATKPAIRSRWTTDLYPKIFTILQKNRFETLVKNAFRKSEINKMQLCDLRDFIRGCINLNPQKRPIVDDLLQHKTFGGEKDFRNIQNDVWKTRYGPMTLEFFVSLYVGRVEFTQSVDENEYIQIESGESHTSCDSAVEPENEAATVSCRRREFMAWVVRKNSFLSRVIDRVFHLSKHKSVNSA